MRPVALLVMLVVVAAPLGAQQNLLSEVSAARAKYPTPISGPQIGAVLNEVALAHVHDGWRLMAKSDGNHCPQPITFTAISCDILLHLPSGHWFDVLRDAEGDGAGQGVPQWSDNGVGDMSAAVMPVGIPAPVPMPVPVPVPTPQPIPAPVPVPLPIDWLSGVSLRLDVLAQQLAAHDERLRKHDDEPGYLVKILGNRYVQLVLAGIGTWFAKQELDQ